VARWRPLQCILFYFLSFVCDELDGRFARMLNQTSTLGAVLDMVTDRCTGCGGCDIAASSLIKGTRLTATCATMCLLRRLATTGLLLLLSVIYPKYILACVLLIFLDIFSHWFQMYSTLLTGAATHKARPSEQSWLGWLPWSTGDRTFCCTLV
jgi:CDP-diacylglycerol--inositol 3-phosphatidyltransferase